MTTYYCQIISMTFQAYRIFKNSPSEDLLLLAIAKNVRPNLHSVEEHVYFDIYKIIS